MDERDWFCERCGVPYDTEAEAVECARLDIDYGIGATPAILVRTAA